MNEFWQGLGRGVRMGLVTCVALIAIATGVAAWWFLHTDYQVLFSDLRPDDAAVMTSELDKLKVPYRLDEASGAILVDRAQVHATRIKLMGKDMPLHGAVGFELFNNTDFGMTEFAQKINYQRAMQGELTRTILSLSEVRDVRVHLALPEQGLFKQLTAKPKAALTLTMREGQSLRPEQVSGIQRLVAAATPGMTPQDVTVLDKKGVALSRSSEDASDSAAGGNGTGRLQLKKETEDQLVRKAAAVLEQTFGAGQALASVDVVLNMDQVRTTTEDIIPAPSRATDSKGVMVKERESVRDGNTVPFDNARSASGVMGGSSTQRDVDYQVGRRVEQVVSPAGAVRRIQVVAVVRQSLEVQQEEQLKRLLAAAVGANPERGDTVVVQSMRTLAVSKGAEHDSVDSPAATSAPHMVGKPAESVALSTAPDQVIMLIAALAVLVLFGLLVTLGLHRRRAEGNDSSVRPMGETERQAALRQVQDWMSAENISNVPSSGAGRQPSGYSA
ncbi:flagellar basal-body MS-ring/collar protein FliF [Xylophilus sp. ASV27]|uniref:flagellar basal-body MS-ring/collar protein FliF n=1 Tax=Xylophilus sp. ASV27 TaxID=2795129 RepID=UPI00351C7145